MSRTSRRLNRESARRANNSKVVREINNNQQYFNSMTGKRERIEKIKEEREIQRLTKMMTTP